MGLGKAGALPPPSEWKTASFERSAINPWRSPSEEADCHEVLQQVAACRGALNGFMAELFEGHIRCHVLDENERPKPRQKRAAEELIDIVHSYMK